MNFLNPWELARLDRQPGLVLHQPLRVQGGEASSAQLRAAQAVHQAFCTAMRVSVVPNPAQYGYLPDGSPYVITAVGQNVVMQLWVGGDPAVVEPYPAGVGLSIDSGPAAKRVRTLFVLSWLNGGWKVTMPRYFFGGSGLWSSSKGEQRLSWLSGNDTAGYQAVTGHVPQDAPGAEKDTLGHGGLAYRIKPGHEAADRAALPASVMSGRYVRLTKIAEIQGGRVGILTAQAVDPRRYAQTPLEPAQMVNAFQTLLTPVPAGLLPLDEPLVPASFLRGSNRIMVPLQDMSLELGSEAGPALSQFPITHEGAIALDDGDWVWSVNEVGAILKSSSPLLNGFPRRHGDVWNARFEQQFQAPSGMRYVTVGDWGYIPFIGEVELLVPVRQRYTYWREFVSQAPVYRANGWKDEPLEFLIRYESSDQFYENADTVSAFMAVNYWNEPKYYQTAQPMVFGDSLFTQTSDATRDPNYNFMSGYDSFTSNSGWKPPLPEIPSQSEITGDLANDFKRTLITPWGEIVLEHTSCALRYTNVPSISAFTGKIESRAVSFVDRFLGVIVYGETVLTPASTTPTSDGGLDVQMVGATYAVVTVCGKEVWRQKVSDSDWTTKVVNHLSTPIRNISLISHTKPYENPHEEGDFTIEYEKYQNGELMGTVSNGWHWSIDYEGGSVEEYTFRSDVPGFLSPLNGGYLSGYSASDFEVSTAVDPASGAGVVVIKKGGALQAAFALSPLGIARSLDSVIQGRKGGLSAENPSIKEVVSV